MKRCLEKITSIYWAFLMVIAASVLVVFYMSAEATHAEALSWFSAGATAELIDDPLVGTPRIANHTHQCQEREIKVGSFSEAVDGCVYQAKSFQFAYIEECTQTRWGCNNTSTMAVKTDDDPNFYRINNLYPYWQSYSWHVSPMSDTVVLNDAGSVRVIVDLLAAIDTAYSYKGQEYTLSARGSSYFGDQSRTINVAMSSNGDWLVGGLEGYGLFRIDLSNGTLQGFSSEAFSRDVYVFGISDNGRSVITGESRQKASIYQVDGNCAQAPVSIFDDPLGSLNDEAQTSCPSKLLVDVLSSSSGVDYSSRHVRSVRYVDIDSSGNFITFLEKLGGNQERWVKLTKPGYVEPYRLKYLAMGDSYSSGEGDVGEKPDGSSYYLPGTEDRGKCHISSRSYPFLLRDHYGISEEGMKSVACSGAQIVFDYWSNMKSYVGQHNELAEQDEAGRERMRQDAIDNFFPGIVPQLEFVKRYTPEVVTLTGGGNDVGFSDILTYCGFPQWEDLVLPSSITDCGYATPGSELEKLLLDAIDTQYIYNKKLVESIKESSPDTRIIILGYPSFISSDDFSCSLTYNSGSLSKAERVAINKAISHMNTMLRRLAHNTAVSYVDIQDVLNGGRMCEGSKYMTGITAAGYQDVISGESVQEIFHPNALGHEKIANKIKQEGVFETDKIPERVEYTPREDAVTSLPTKLVEDAQAAFGSSIKIITKPFTFDPSSLVNLVGYSDKVSLGVYETTPQGGMNETVDISAMQPGRHLLVLEGTTPLGAPVKYYQYITVLAPPQQTFPLDEVGEPPGDSGGDEVEKSYIPSSGAPLVDGRVQLGQDGKLALTDDAWIIGAGEEVIIDGGGDVKGVSRDRPWAVAIAFSGVLLVGGVGYVFKRKKNQQE